MKLPQDEENAKHAHRAAIVCLIIWILACCIAASVQADESHERAINAYIDHFHRLVRPSRARKAKRYTPIIVRESLQRGLDPFLVAVLAAVEASYKPESTGARGERGLLQVMPRFCKGCDLSTPEGQIRAGANKLQAAFDKCGDVRGALTYYATGYTCKSNSVRTRKKIQWRVRYYKKMKERFGK